MPNFTTICSTIFGLFLSISTQAQVYGGQQTKLFDLFAFEKYEDCLYKAERMTISEKTRRDPEPYLYMSMCFYKISLMPDQEDLDEVYKDPLKDAISYAGKFIKKDKKGELVQVNIGYFNELKGAGLSQIVNLLDQDLDYRKAASFGDKILRFSEDQNILFLTGVCQLISLNSQGEDNVKTSYSKILSEYRSPGFKKDEISEPALILGMRLLADHLIKTSQMDSCKSLISNAKDILPDSKEITDKYNEIFDIVVVEEKPKEKDGVKIKYKTHSSSEDVEIPSNAKEIEKENKINSIDALDSPEELKIAPVENPIEEEPKTTKKKEKPSTEVKKEKKTENFDDLD